MWFKNLLAYQLTADLAIDAGELEKALGTKKARACANQEMSTYGFVAPIGKGDDALLAHVSGDFILISARKEERILPNIVVKEAVQEKVEEIEAEQSRKVYKKEREQIKDAIIQAFLPRAFVRRSSTFAAICLKQRLILINSNSSARAEDLLSTLREVIGSLPVRPITVKASPAATMTEWLKNQKAGENFFILDSCVLRDTAEDGGIVRCQRQDLTNDETKVHLDNGKQVTQLSVAWKDKVIFDLDDNLIIRKVKFDDLLQNEVEQNGGDDAASQLDATFTLMMLTFMEMLPELWESLGGTYTPEGI